MFSFGENNIYTQLPNPKGSKLRKLQNFLTGLLGFSPPIFHGRGVFNYTFGLLPYRTPINTVCELCLWFSSQFLLKCSSEFWKEKQSDANCGFCVGFVCVCVFVVVYI